MWLLVVVVCILTILVYLLLFESTNYWRKRKVPYSKPWPLFGNMAPFVFKRRSALELFKDLYNEFPNKRYNGIYTFTTPTLLIRDPELIKQITVKDFEYFHDRWLFRMIEEVDPVLSQNLVSLHGQKWHKMRSILSPFFTSSKMKFMFNLVIDCAEEYVKNVEKDTDSDVIIIEMKDFLMRFSNDVIATTAFGIKVNSINEKNNEFYRMGSDMISIEGLRILRALVYLVFPVVVKFFKISCLPVRFMDYFTGIVKQSIKLRETAGFVRPDMIQIFLEAQRRTSSTKKKKSKKPRTDEIVMDENAMVAQALIFYIGGIENTSITMSFMCYELALNMDIQRKLQSEIDEVMKQCGGKVTYDALLGMKYLDMVVLETLRKWPTGPMFERLCVKDYVITPKQPNEERITIEKGMNVFIPFGALQHDPKYFPHPLKFDPERFGGKNKQNITPFSYMPFGEGPRNCIAKRYALMKTKCIVFYLLAKFDIVPVEKTSIPIVETKLRINMGSEKEIWLGLRRRESNLIDI